MGVVFGKPLTPAEVARRVWDAGYPTKEPCYVCAAVDARTTVDNLSGIYPIGPMGEDGDAWSALVAEARARLSQGGTEKS